MSESKDIWEAAREESAKRYWRDLDALENQRKAIQARADLAATETKD
jgi:hypothetical protein